MSILDAVVLMWTEVRPRSENRKLAAWRWDPESLRDREQSLPDQRGRTAQRSPAQSYK